MGGHANLICFPAAGDGVELLSRLGARGVLVEWLRLDDGARTSGYAIQVNYERADLPAYDGPAFEPAGSIDIDLAGMAQWLSAVLKGPATLLGFHDNSNSMWRVRFVDGALVDHTIIEGGSGWYDADNDDFQPAEPGDRGAFHSWDEELHGWASDALGRDHGNDDFLFERLLDAFTDNEHDCAYARGSVGAVVGPAPEERAAEQAAREAAIAEERRRVLLAEAAEMEAPKRPWWKFWG